MFELQSWFRTAKTFDRKKAVVDTFWVVTLGASYIYLKWHYKLMTNMSSAHTSLLANFY